MRRVYDHVAGLMAGVLALVTMATIATAQIGQPAPGQMGFQGAASPVMEEISAFHDQVNVIIIAIAVFVLLLMLWVIFRYNSKSNPEPSNFSHNTVLEVAWTVVPILILVYIGVFSFKLLFLQYTYPKPDLTIKATGNAWYWDHSYPDQGDFTVTSTMIRDQDVLKEEMGEDAFDKKYGALEGLELLRAVYTDARPLYEKKGLVRQLSVDNEIAVPLNAVVHMLVTSADVIHSWTIPSFGSKTQAVPGRLTATWFKATRIGVYYGQCSVICGKDHSSMPIAIRVVAKDDFDKWVEAAKAGDWKKAKTILLDATKSAKTDRKADGKKVAQAGAAIQN
ncbi:MAG: cytochrome c oxidase subunit II [Pseudomonadota bacterium]